MRPVRVHLGFGYRPAKHGVVVECTKQFVMARPRFVLPGDECIDDPQACERADPQCGDRAAGVDAAIGGGRVFERADHGRPDGNDAPVPSPRGIDRISGPRGDLIRLGKREHRIEPRVAGGGNPGGVRQRRECRSARAQGIDEAPIEEKPRGRSFEGDRAAGNRCPGIPDRQWISKIRVLNRTSVPRQPFPNLLSRTFELHIDQPWMLEDRLYDGAQRAELQGVTHAERRRKGPRFGRCSKVAGTKRHRCEGVHVLGNERSSSGEPQLDATACGQVNP